MATYKKFKGTLFLTGPYKTVQIFGVGITGRKEDVGKANLSEFSSGWRRTDWGEHYPDFFHRLRGALSRSFHRLRGALSRSFHRLRGSLSRSFHRLRSAFIGICSPFEGRIIPKFSPTEWVHLSQYFVRLRNTFISSLFTDWGAHYPCLISDRGARLSESFHRLWSALIRIFSPT